MDFSEKKIPNLFKLADLNSFTSKLNSKSKISDWKDFNLDEDLIKGLIEGLNLKCPLEIQKIIIPSLIQLKNSNYLYAAPTGNFLVIHSIS